MISLSTFRHLLLAVRLHIVYQSGGSVFLSVIALALSNGVVLAQPGPPAFGDEERAREVEDALEEKEAFIGPERPGARDPEGGTIYVRSVKLEGNSQFGESTLLGVTGEGFGRQMSLAELRSVASKIESYYHERGFGLVKVVIPQQDVPGQNGILRMQVLEGVLGEVKVSGNERFSTERVRRYFRNLKSGAPLRLEALNDAVYPLNQLSGIKASLRLEPGSEVGSTDLRVNVEEADRVQFEVEFNNFGTESTGLYRVIPRMTLPNFSGRGDVLTAQIVSSVDPGETFYGLASYATPLDVGGFSLSGYISGGRYEVGEEFSALGVEGSNAAGGLGLSYDLLKSAKQSLTLEGWLVHRDAKQEFLGTVQSDDKIRKLQIGLQYDRRSAYGRTIAALKYHQGLGEALGGMEDDSARSSRSFARADNSFSIVSIDLARIQRLTDHFIVIARASGQYAFVPVVASEQWAIGGANSVRGHPQSIYLGDQGYTLTLEGRYTILPELVGNYQLCAFIDHGAIEIDTPISTQGDSESVSGAGVGLRASPRDDLNIRLDVAFPLGEVTDNDVTVYLQARYSF